MADKFDASSINLVGRSKLLQKFTEIKNEV